MPRNPCLLNSTSATVKVQVRRLELTWMAIVRSPYVEIEEPFAAVSGAPRRPCWRSRAEAIKIDTSAPVSTRWRSPPSRSMTHSLSLLGLGAPAATTSRRHRRFSNGVLCSVAGRRSICTAWCSCWLRRQTSCDRSIRLRRSSAAPLSVVIVEKQPRFRRRWRRLRRRRWRKAPARSALR